MKERSIDLVFCLDMTGSTFHFAYEIAYNIDQVYKNVLKIFSDEDKQVGSVRLKLILFKDYESDSDPMTISEFFTLPEDEQNAKQFILSTRGGGGGDLPENGLEALYYAMKSDFVLNSNCRQIIALFTDSDAVELGERSHCAGYPEDLLGANMDTLVDAWNLNICNDNELRLLERSKRLIIFAPAGTKYEVLKGCMNRCLFEPVEVSNSLFDFDFESFIESLIALNYLRK